jgi:DNA-binding response OmpR family regulator
VVRHLIAALDGILMARVSVINDSEEFLDLMRDLLASLGHQMTGFKAVEASIEGVVDSEPELLVVDLRLQDRPQEISGWELIVLARSHRHLVDVPLILCTADEWELKKRSADLEQIAGVHVRTKPFDVDEMCNLINHLLAEGRGAQASTPSPSSVPMRLARKAGRDQAEADA